jgi:hypothetical protein
LRESVELVLDRDGEVTVDFDGVMVISPSFADELFAKLPRAAIESGRVRFVNLDEDHEALVRFVFEGRDPGRSNGAAA